jgi:hypothetical protein
LEIFPSYGMLVCVITILSLSLSTSFKSKHFELISDLVKSRFVNDEPLFYSIFNLLTFSDRYKFKVYL